MAGKKKAKPTQTTNPLHLEDLDPRRFEDLIRQLVYDFRTWRRLDPIGRQGSDGGIDILGTEVVDTAEEHEAEGEDEVDEGGEPVEREWRIQCKRYKRLSAGGLRAIVRELVPDPSAPPHGALVATAADVSADAFAAFRDEAAKRGIREAHLWTRSTIEDLLYRPANDHLLFGYFGISLQVRQRGRLTEVRRRIALKRKILRACGLKAEDFTGKIDKDILVRNIEDEHFPYGPDRKLRLPGLTDDAPSQDCSLESFHPQGIIVSQFSYVGWRKPDGTWDAVRESRGSAGHVANNIRIDIEREQGRVWTEPPWSKFNGHIPERESVIIYESSLIPYENLLEVDPFGEPWFPGVHILCRFEGKRGPYRGATTLRSSKWHSVHYTEEHYLDRDARGELYKELELKLADQATSTAPTAAGGGDDEESKAPDG